MLEDLLAPTVIVVTILGFTTYLHNRLETKFDKLFDKNESDHGAVNERLLAIEDKLGLVH